jgi:16S rRNA G966 N2-methylase RsmD
VASSTKFVVEEQLNRQIPPEAHTAMYVWHKYWSRKTWNVVGQFIETYSQKGEIILDPFSGSGVVAIEAARRGRKAIVIDLNPVASMITELTLRQVDTVKLHNSFLRVSSEVKQKVEKLYRIHCIKCEGILIGDAFVRVGDALTEVRYQKCPHCGTRCESHGPDLRDVHSLEKLENEPIQEWYPKNKFEYPDGSPFKKREHYKSVDELFTKRNLQALAWIHESIQKEDNTLLKKFLMGAFSSMLHLCTRMMPVGNPSSTNHYTFFSSPGWTQHTYWSAPKYMEQNVWDKFEGAVTGPQGIINAKKDSETNLPKVRLTHDWKKVLEGDADIAIVTADCLKIMKAMPSKSVDYIFTDPPYDSSIQYGELSLLWNSWLKFDAKYTETLVASEIINNDRQQKSFDVYHALLSAAFGECFASLKPERYMNVTFHNPTFKVRNATVRAAVFAGFDYQKIHHQPLGQVSAQSMMQPFGSAQGDFYLRFFKPHAKAKHDHFEEVTDERFRKIVVETCKEVIAERAEPTPYTILVNYVDPVLAKQGLFGVLNTGLDVKTALEESIDKEFVLIDAKIGGASGKLWWFKDPVFIARLKEIPLTERVERTVENTLRNSGKVTFTEVWDAVSREFPNSLTSDSTSISEALQVYARKVGNGYWMLRDEIKQRIRAHSEIIALLALIGKARGYDIWIGSPEQGDVAEGLAGTIQLRNLVTFKQHKIKDVQNLKDVLLMDLLWLKDGAVETAFEVESTTTMTSGLQRGSNLLHGIRKVMVMPEERKIDFDRKMQSPLFSQAFSTQNWNLLFFDKFREAYSAQTTNVSIEDLFGALSTSKPKLSVAKEKATQGTLDFT